MAVGVKRCIMRGLIDAGVWMYTYEERRKKS
jgi:hypothetical protein